MNERGTHAGSSRRMPLPAPSAPSIADRSVMAAHLISAARAVATLDTRGFTVLHSETPRVDGKPGPLTGAASYALTASHGCAFPCLRSRRRERTGHVRPAQGGRAGPGRSLPVPE